MNWKPMSDLPPNARYCVLLEPMWAVLGTVVIYYATLYMTTAGLSTVHIGLIVSISLYVAFFFQLAAGALTDKLGRRRATFWFDVLSWVIPMFLWAVADSFWIFLLAYLFNATSRVVNVSFSLLATEDAPEEQRPRVFAAIKLIIMAAGLLTPVVGLFMDWYGTLPTLRVVYLVGGLCMLVHVVWRNRLTSETAAGTLAQRAHGSTGVIRRATEGLRLFWSMAGDRRMWPITAIYVLTYLAWQINIFQVVYLADVLDFGVATISYLPALSALVALFCYLWVMPRLRRRSIETNTLAALVICGAGWVVFLVVPERGLVLLVVSTVLTGAGLFLVESYRDALVVSRLAARDRATLFSGIQSVTALVAIPSGYVAALVYDNGPGLLFGAISAMYLVGAVIALLLRNPVTDPDAPESPQPSSERSERLQSWSEA